MLIHGYLPRGLMDTKIVPLVKKNCAKFGVLVIIDNLAKKVLNSVF